MSDWMYVLERATLLHDAIRRNLEARLPTIRAWNYLSAYDGMAAARWAEFGHALDEQIAGADQIVEAARTAFECHRQWFVVHEATVAQA